MLKISQEGHTANIHVFQKSSGNRRSTATRSTFRRQLNVSFADIFADTLKFGSHCRVRRKEDGSRSLGRSSDTVHYSAGNGREIEVEESRKSHVSLGFPGEGAAPVKCDILTTLHARTRPGGRSPRSYLRYVVPIIFLLFRHRYLHCCEDSGGFLPATPHRENPFSICSPAPPPPLPPIPLLLLHIYRGVFLSRWRPLSAVKCNAR
ncbi:hypothetical protein ALC62_04931 [Cyphomyrmex costatus]|uniref:Uncharacterized protein n=1 Tax=Cyphomyrmex costatus TaxID=456900 RepID=A0A195CTZ9_9HYME|nr:hypothetical protein ALC62_04931 [Cyphomyrmex costatus]